MRIVIAAGGSGGHIVPGLAVAEALQELEGQTEIYFVGSGSGLENKLVRERGYQLHALPAAPFHGRGVAGVLRLMMTLPRALFAALKLFREVRPNAVVGFGGYPSFMPVLAAWLRGTPCVLHESNVKAGTANRVLQRFAKRVYAVSGAYGLATSGNILHLPNPVLRQFYEVRGYAAPAPGSAPRVVVIGGSQGAMSLNDAVLSLVDVFREYGVELFHQTGSADYERVRQEYQRKGYEPFQLVEFVEDVRTAYEEAHLVISRAGAMTVAELSAAGRPAIFVPLAIAGGHQGENIKFLLEAGAARSVVSDEQLQSGLAREVQELLESPGLLEELSAKMRGAAGAGELRPAENIAKGVLEIAGTN